MPFHAAKSRNAAKRGEEGEKRITVESTCVGNHQTGYNAIKQCIVVNLI